VLLSDTKAGIMDYSLLLIYQTLNPEKSKCAGIYYHPTGSCHTTFYPANFVTISEELKQLDVWQILKPLVCIKTYMYLGIISLFLKVAQQGF
jgi:hypothetical protein